MDCSGFFIKLFMMIQEKGYHLNLLLFSAVLFVFVYLFRYFAPENIVSDYLLWIVPFFYVISVLSRFFIKRKSGNDTKKSLAMYMGTSAVKLFLYLAILIVYGFLNREDAAAFFISFFFIYIVYTFIEVMMVLKLTSK